MHQAALAQEMGATASRGGSRASLLAFLQISLTSIFCEDDLFDDVRRKAEEHAHHLFQRARREGGCLGMMLPSTGDPRVPHGCPTAQGSAVGTGAHCAALANDGLLGG